MSSERVEGIEAIRRIRWREPLRTPSWVPPLPPKPREAAEQRDREEEGQAGHVDLTV